MKKIYILIIINLFCIRLQAQNFEWAKREGQGAYDYGKGIATDNSGNVYVAGKYELNANFSGTILPCQGNHDIYVAKYSSSGSLTWIRTAGGVNGDYAHALACDGAYVYVAGEIEGFGTTIKFIGSSVTLTSKGVNDAFLAKYDLNGNLIWAREAGGIDNDEALGITYDNSGNVYICGFFNNTATFGTTTVYGFGGNDIYVAKYDSNGVFQWVRTAGSAGRDEAKGIKCDAAGNVYVCGTYLDRTVFGSQILSSPNGYFNAFLAKYTPDGTLAWVKTAGGDYDDVAWGVAIDNADKIYIAGEFNAYALFDGIPLITTGSANVFVACYDESGNIQWAKGAGGRLIDRARAIGCDGTNLYITGQFGLLANFDSYSVTGVDSSEIFIAKLNNAGNFQWIATIGGPPDAYESLGYEAGDAVCAEPSGNVYTTGALLDGGVFGNISFNPYNRTDVFVCKISQNIVPPVTSNPSSITVMVGQQASFSVSATGSFPLTYQWEKNGINIPAANASSYIINNTQYTDTGHYNVVVTNIYGSDTSNSATLTVIPFINSSLCTASGTISRDYWANITGTSVSNIPINTAPTSTSQLSVFEAPQNLADNYGQRIRGYICPPLTGNYIFWISSDDNSELWLSTDDNPANKIKIASVTGWTSSREWTKYPTQQSAPISLIAGQKYYIEALHKEGSQGDNCAVGWQLPDNSLERPIPGSRLSAYVIPLSVAITSPANNSFLNFGSPVIVQATATVGTGTIQKVEFFADTVKLGESTTSPYNFTWNNPAIGTYALTVKATDSGNNTAVSSIVTISIIPTVTCDATGSISIELWNNIGGTSVSAIPLGIAPSSTEQLSVFEAPQNLADNYGQRIRGYICPPLTGNYIFWIASDDNSELWLSSNDNPVNKIKIASVTGWTSSREWTKYPSQQSVPISLIAGQKYYIEALHKEGSQGDNCAVGWQLPNGALERPIIGSRLSPFITSSINPPLVSITSPTDNTSYPGQTNITINATATSTGGSIAKVEFYQGITKIGEDLAAPYSFTWQNVTAGNYVLKAIATDNISQTATSQVVNISVNGCSTPKITALGPTTMCSGSVTLQSNTGSGFIYQWQKDGVNINGATNSSYTAAVSGGYQIKIIQGSCISWSAPTAVKIQSGLRASITPGGSTTFCTGGNVKLFANTCSGYIYQWKLNGSYIPGATASIYIATTAGNYQVQITQGGVNAWSALVTVTINACRESEINQGENANPVQAISEPSDPLNRFQMKIYPNPNTGFFTIIINMALTKEEKIKMRIVNVLGQEVYSKEYAIKDNYLKETVELDKSLPTGIYTLQLIIGNKTENTNVVLAR